MPSNVSSLKPKDVSHPDPGSASAAQSRVSFNLQPRPGACLGVTGFGVPPPAKQDGSHRVLRGVNSPTYPLACFLPKALLGGTRPNSISPRQPQLAPLLL